MTTTTMKPLIIAALLLSVFAQARNYQTSGCADGVACSLNSGEVFYDDLWFATYQWCGNASTQSSSWCCITTYEWYYPHGDTGADPVMRKSSTFKAQNPAYCSPYVANGGCGGPLSSPAVYSCVHTAPLPPGPG